MAIDKYLYSHYKGKYRVYPELDLDTNDFPRDEDGEIDKDYSDFYMKGRSNIKVVHGVGSELACIIPSNGVGRNVVRQYCSIMTSKDFKDYEKASKTLIKNGYANTIDFLDGEVYMAFDAKFLDSLNKIIKLKTSGANISPLSNRNLPKTPYEIPITDLERYKLAKDGIPPLAIGKLNNEFGKSVWKDDYNKLLRESHLKAMQFFHKENKWNEYCEYIKNIER